ncbi:alpha/beta fold hydrolase [Acidovorax sp. CCYZU-2555]|uniref:alpha/beta fold hydrolase n=1 Tax=Acidovorax sp. CCYZU-2555 TaxID=2835042 RepID=UPI001BCEFB6C|nr:alpha/beta fold hydrolase [Acidovorax sp. CCYZU-2555]MBS7780459.1 alpha/beta fold hydrolase [Acidovorax sp. CCYZU-2555]
MTHDLDPRPGRCGPLSLRDMGAFHVGGQAVQLQGLPSTREVLAAGGEPVLLDPNGRYWVGQMYAQYFLPQAPTQTTPLQLWHGGGLTGACWETTPDGRPGWLHYFVRRGWDTYLCDAAERGRAGYAPQHLWGAPLSQTAEAVFARFRLGPGLGGVALADAARQAFPEGQFPAEAFEALARQLVPRWAHTDAVILDAYAALLNRVAPSAVVCHSQGGMFGLTMAQRRPDRVRAVVALEPAAVPPPSDEDTGYAVPTLIILGDRIDGDARWPAMRARIEAFARRHASVEILSLPDLGMRGNSHMLMMDRNQLDIADLAHDWLARTLKG